MSLDEKLNSVYKVLNKKPEPQDKIEYLPTGRYINGVLTPFYKIGDVRCE